VAAAVSAALISGLKKDPTPCELCQGTGGIKCFACEGEGNSQKKREKLEGMRPAGGKRDFVGRVQNNRACRVCGGTGLVLCSQCRGSGYTTKL
jgi:DnaJ-class molecular chaperone